MTDQQDPGIEVWIGLDVGKHDHHATLLSTTGDKLGDRAVKNREDDLAALLDTADGLGVPALVIDQPGSIGTLAVQAALRRGIAVAYVPGLVMRRAADLYPGESKTDKRDSLVLADHARLHATRLRWLRHGDEDLQTLQLLAGRDHDLAHDATRTSNRLRDLLLQAHPPLEAIIGPNLKHAAIRHLLTRYGTASQLRNAGRSRVLKVLQRDAPRIAQRLRDDIFHALDQQTITVPADHTIGRLIQDLARDLQALHERRETLEHELQGLLAAHPLGPILDSLPGIGTKTGVTILSEIGDPTRFQTAGHLAAYAGLAPVTRQSGSSIRGQTRSRRGNHRLKNALFLSAFASLKHPPSKAYYDKKRAEGKRHNAAVLCLARKRCDLIHKMLRTQTPYRYEPPTTT
ncbi:MAG: IS110 family transposase [Solirubrobacteraceae bacterium]|nr:IS110 family transposase [Solirubrobacteraceae bacterium]